MVESDRATPTNGKFSVLAAVCLAALVLPLSFSAGAVATPSIGRALGGDAAALTWITNAFMLTFGSSLMAAGALADQVGRRRVFLSGIVCFVVLSCALSLAPTVLVLDLLRAAQGLAAAAALAGGSAVLAQEFDGTARIRAFSLLGTTFGLGLAFGPILAGVLIDAYGWRSVFLSAAAVGALAIAFGGPRIKESRDPNATGLDWPGSITFTAALTMVTFGVIEGPAFGWTSPPVLLLFAGAVVMLAAFITAEKRSSRPMLDLSLFRYPLFVGVQVLPVATCYCYVVLLVALPLRFIGIEGRSETEAGLMTLALSAPMLFVPFGAALLSRWLSAGLLSSAGLLVAAAGLLWLGRIAPGSGAVDYIGPMLTIGAGTGFPWGLMDGLSVSVVPRERAGMATGIFSTMRVAGEGIALAIVGALLSALLIAQLTALQPETMPLERTAAALRLATGDAAPALALVGPAGREALVAGYGRAFAQFLDILAAITAVSAAVVFVLFRYDRTETPVLDAAGEGASGR